MIYSCIHKNMRKTTPIYEKIVPSKWMRLTKPLTQMIHKPCSCKVLTNSYKNIWTFQYHAKHLFTLGLSFIDQSKDPYAYILVEPFIFSKTLRNQKIDHEFFKLFLFNAKNLNFEKILFTIKHPSQINFCNHYGFKQVHFDQMMLSLKPKFIHASQSYTFNRS